MAGTSGCIAISRPRPPGPRPAPSRAQQRRFDAFRHTFNEVRPHEALGQRRPAALYTPSDRLYVPRLRPIAYPEHFEIRRVSTNGGIRWKKRWVNVSHILATLPVGLEPLTSGTWNVFFGPVHLGWLDERDYRIHDRRGRTAARTPPVTHQVITPVTHQLRRSFSSVHLSW